MRNVRFRGKGTASERRLRVKLRHRRQPSIGQLDLRQDLPCRRAFGRKVLKGDNAETLGRLRGHLGTTGTAEVTVVLPLSRGERH